MAMRATRRDSADVVDGWAASSGYPSPVSSLGRIPVLQLVFHVRQELVRDRPVDQPVIVTKGQVGHRPDGDGVVDDHGALLDLADAEDRDLRLTDDRHPEQRT